jgi:hypothetical protein
MTTSYSQKPPQHYLKMAFTKGSNGNELSTPLLGNRPQHESDEEQGCISCLSLTLASAYGGEEEESCEKEAVDYDRQWIKTFVNLVVPPTLLFLQFEMAFFMSPVQGTTGLQRSSVTYAIVLFVITAALYRRGVQDCQITCLVVVLLPEIFMDTVLGLVLCGQVVPAFMLLLSGMQFLAVLTLTLERICECRMLWMDLPRCCEQEKESS